MLKNLLFDPTFSAPFLVGAGCVLALLALAGYWTSVTTSGRAVKVLLAVLRLAVIAGIVTLLMRPMELKPQDEIIEKPIFSILVDDSASMNTCDVGEEDKTRFQAVVEALKNEETGLLDELEKDYQVKFFRFSEDVKRTSLRELALYAKAEGDKTHIANALMNAVQTSGENKQGGVLLLSDGRDNESENLQSARGVARHLRSMKIPIWTVPVGTTTEVKDIYVRARLSSNFLFVDQPATLQVEVDGTGYENWYARVNLYRENEYVSSKEIPLRSGRAQTHFTIRESSKGAFQYRVEVEPMAGEADLVNNRRSVIARVVDERTQVLVLEAKPYWDSKFLLRALREDPNIDVTSIFHINARKTFAIADKTDQGDFQKKTSSENIRMPRTKEELYKYDCLFFGKDIDKTLSTDELRLLRDYLTERGGSIIFFRGKAYTGENLAIAAIEPVVWGSNRLERARFELTSQGRSSPIFNFSSGKSSDVILRELPEMISITEIKNEKSLAVVLAKSKTDGKIQDVAAIAYQRYGKGKVMTIAATGLWRWAFMPEKLAQYDDVYRKFWAQMIRWLISGSDFLPGQDIAFQIDKYTYAPGETVRFTVQTKLVDPAQFNASVEMTQPDGKIILLKPVPSADQPSIRTAFYVPKQEGEYKAVMKSNQGKKGDLTARFTVYHDSVEQRYVSADRELMTQLSSMTGGKTIELNALDTLPTHVREFQRLTREKIKPRDVWDQLSIFSILIGVLGLEWLIRRKSGLV